MRLMALVLEINYSSLILSEHLTATCAKDLLPVFHQDYYPENLDCFSKYLEKSAETAGGLKTLTCPKKEMTLVWEESSNEMEVYGCLNSQCCAEIISVIKMKFDLMASIALVGAAYLLVGIKMSQYFIRKLQKFKTYVLSHRRDKQLFVGIVVCLAAVIILSDQVPIEAIRT